MEVVMERAEKQLGDADKRLKDADKKLDSIWERKKRLDPVEKATLQALDEEIESTKLLIDQVITGDKIQDLLKIKEAKATIEKARKLKSHEEQLWRETQLLNPGTSKKSKLKLKQALWWFSQQGGRKELPLIQTLRFIPPYTDDQELHNLLEKTQKDIESRLFAEGVYQVFCAETEIKQLFQQLDLGIVVIESYDAFVIISADEEAIVQI